MKKILFLIIFFSLVTRVSFSAPDKTISIPNTAVSGTVISSSDYNENNNQISTQYNSHTHTDITALGTVSSGTWAATPVGTSYGGTGNTNGIGLPSGAIFFMITGSCPSGSTDVSATYANKFIKINSTAGTSSGTVLTGTSDSHILDSTEIPSHRHDVKVNDGGSGSGRGPEQTADGHFTSVPYYTENTGGGLGHTHTLSSATTLEPSSITCKMCQVN